MAGVRSPPPLHTLLRRSELTGRRSSSLLSIPAELDSRIDDEQGDKPHESSNMPALVRKLEQHLVMRAPATERMLELLQEMTARICDSSQQRSAFLICRGDVIVERFLLLLAADASAQETDAQRTPQMLINECMQLLVRTTPRPILSVPPDPVRAFPWT